MEARPEACDECGEKKQIHKLWCESESCQKSLHLCHECKTGQEFSHWKSSVYCLECKDEHLDFGPVDNDVNLDNISLSDPTCVLIRPHM